MVVRKALQGGTPKSKGHLRDCIEVSIVEASLNYLCKLKKSKWNH